MGNQNKPVQSVCVIGCGPAGLMAAEILAGRGVPVDIFDAMPSAGRKLLVAGKGGLNLTHSEPYDQFVARYGSSSGVLRRYLDSFGPEDVREWARALGIETFIGSSNRVFPMGMKTFPLLKAWLTRLSERGVAFHFRHRWSGWSDSGELKFTTPLGERLVHAEAVILALGGGSWKKLGSDGAWVSILGNKGIQVAPLKPANCGFDANWTAHFSSRFAGSPVKPVILTFGKGDHSFFRQQGEFIITATGVEGSLVYAASALLRDEIDTNGTATVTLDLAPDRTIEYLESRLAKPRGTRSLANHLQKSVGIKDVKAGLLREVLSPAVLSDPIQLASAIKSLPISLNATRPLDEAISTAGGVIFEELDENLMLHKLPGVFCTGEMLDWEAPTGGYLITACMSTGRAAGLGVLKWLQASFPSDPV